MSSGAGSNIRLVQVKKGMVRRVALVQEPDLWLVDGCKSVYELANFAIAAGIKLSVAVEQRASGQHLNYDDVYNGQSEWHLLAPIDHPDEPARCLVSGTGLTHVGSARDRQAMHASSEAETDSMRMFRWGVEAGRPESGKIGIPPEWFYKGTGNLLRGHGQLLEVPAYAEDGGEEGEIAGIYVIAPNGAPYRVGMAGGNEFSDHRFEKRNYLNLAASKLRTCSLGPELVVDPQFESVLVEVKVERAGTVLWSKTFRTGEKEMCHSLENLEHHHFKFEGHRRPGDVHVHFFGTDCLSFGDGVHLEDGDVMQIKPEGFGRPLRNPLRVVAVIPSLVKVASL